MCFKCPLCESRKRPNSQRPSHLVKSLNFNEVVGVDLFFVRSQPLLNVLCWGTDLMHVEILPMRSEVVFEALQRGWIAHYGPPRLIICDQGREFLGLENPLPPKSTSLASFCTSRTWDHLGKTPGLSVQVEPSKASWKQSSMKPLQKVNWNLL